MNPTQRAMTSRYLAWAKLNSVAEYNLATSGIQSYSLSALPLQVSDLEINGPDSYGYQPLLQKLAQLHNIHPDRVFTTNGTSMANHLAMAATLSPGDDVLIECPTYGLLLDVASYLGANILRFSRPPENSFQLDLEEVRAKITPKTRLIVVTNLHNPSGALTGEATLTKLGEIAASVGARVLVDEVYLPTTAPPFQDPDGTPPRSSIHLGDNFIVTSSLTKAYGLSGLRCGWVLADPALTLRIWQLNDLFNATPVYPSELLSVLALDNLPQIAARAAKILQTNRQSLDAFLQQASGIEFFSPAAGTICFPRLTHGTVADFCHLLRTEYQTGVVPGDFFEMPRHFRIGLGGDPAMTAEGLDRLASALHRYQAR